MSYFISSYVCQYVQNQYLSHQPYLSHSIIVSLRFDYRQFQVKNKKSSYYTQPSKILA
ncbi:hypothetical protein XBJ1_2842 [Xenorhabdus bovienii SS-2004]|uniref:Uncharacterized protein n=1 Tax=Xenorhabdus bovienii (strain SS-2004) TaxID=406818 RepID=D3V804_XENBS|nr:hypothetical protein XBJ1_2842 [Xenorhabdus bovienii SS-2004]